MHLLTMIRDFMIIIFLFNNIRDNFLMSLLEVSGEIQNSYKIERN